MNALVEIYAKYVINGTRAIDTVPVTIREDVAKRIEELEQESEE